MAKRKITQPDRIRFYFYDEIPVILWLTISGLICNVGKVLGPWYEGKLAQALCDVFGGSAEITAVFTIALWYVLTSAAVEGTRCIKRYCSRRLSNNIGRRMKRTLYRSMVNRSKPELEEESVGSLMTKAVSDIDTCTEGIRKFSTEVFDTGILIITYQVMLFVYDWKLGLLCMLVPPFAYFAANSLKKRVARRASELKESAGRLNGETLDRVSGTLSYRVLGCEEQRNEAYERRLSEYETAAVRSGILETALQPLYQVLSMAGAVFIIWFGIKNVQGTGTALWNIAAFTTFLSCYAKLAQRASRAAKLFNSVQKARVSWKRIQPWMQQVPEAEQVTVEAVKPLEVRNLTFAYPGGRNILEQVSFTAKPGQIIGITGPVACGKSTLGKAFLCEYPYEGSITYGGEELRDIPALRRCGIVSYLGHDTELMSDTIEENVLLGDEADCMKYLKAVCIDGEVSEMSKGVQTTIGAGGVRLSGGQKARIALARLLHRKRPLVILDDPFAALDHNTELQVMANLRKLLSDSAVLLISHRLYLFPQLDKVLWMENGQVTESTHEELLQGCPAYRSLYEKQMGGGDDEEKA